MAVYDSDDESFAANNSGVENKRKTLGKDIHLIAAITIHSYSKFA